MTTEEEKRRWMDENTFYCARLRADLSPEACQANRRRARGRWLDDDRPAPCATCADWRALCRQVELRRAGKTKEDVMAKRQGTCRWCGEVKNITGRGLCAACYARLKKCGELDKKYPLAPREARAEAAPGHPGMPEAVPDIRGYPVPEPVPEDGPGTGAHGEGPAAIDPLRCERYRECLALPDGDIPLGCPAAAGQVSCDLYGPPQGVIAVDLSRVPRLREVIDERARENFRSPEAEILVLLRDALFKPVGPSRVAPGDHNALELHTRQS